MDGAELQARAAARAEELPGAGMGHPFGEQWDVWKVRGKVFMLQTGTTGEPIVTLKAAPADGRALCEAFDCITPGYHMNKRHWITLHSGDEALDAQLVEDLVTESYLLVVEKSLPKAQWPVDPRTFGRERMQ